MTTQPQEAFARPPYGRCPGAYIAIQESDIFLRRLLALDLVVEQAPEIRRNAFAEGYEVRGLGLRLA